MRQIDIFYDTETTGTKYNKHSIIQLSGIIEVSGRKDGDFNFLIKPHPKALIEDEALHANGHRREDLDSYEPMDVVYRKIIAILSRYIDRYDKTNKAYLLGYNNRGFDDNFFRKFFQLNGDKYFGSWFWSDTIDVLCLASQYLRDRRHKMENFQLGTVARELGIYVQKDRLHDGLYDAEITRDVYKIVTGQEPERNDYDLF